MESNSIIPIGMFNWRRYKPPNPRMQRILPSAGVFDGFFFEDVSSKTNPVLHSRPPAHTTGAGKPLTRRSLGISIRGKTTLQKSTHRFHNTITWLIISVMLFLRIIIYGVVVAINHKSEIWANPVFEIGVYLLTALLIWWERDHLAEFFIDKLALAILILGKPLELILRWFLIINFPPFHPLYFFLYMPVSIGLLFIIYFYAHIYHRYKERIGFGYSSLWLLESWLE
jgi:hypothetical protein